LLEIERKGIYCGFEFNEFELGKQGLHNFTSMLYCRILLNLSQAIHSREQDILEQELEVPIQLIKDKVSI
jgi:hypothetical protein